MTGQNSPVTSHISQSVGDSSVKSTIATCRCPGKTRACLPWLRHYSRGSACGKDHVRPTFLMRRRRGPNWRPSLSHNLEHNLNFQISSSNSWSWKTGTNHWSSNWYDLSVIVVYQWIIYKRQIYQPVRLKTNSMHKTDDHFVNIFCPFLLITVDLMRYNHVESMTVLIEF